MAQLRAASKAHSGPASRDPRRQRSPCRPRGCPRGRPLPPHPGRRGLPRTHAARAPPAGVCRGRPALAGAVHALNISAHTPGEAPDAARNESARSPHQHAHFHPLHWQQSETPMNYLRTFILAAALTALAACQPKTASDHRGRGHLPGDGDRQRQTHHTATCTSSTSRASPARLRGPDPAAARQRAGQPHPREGDGRAGLKDGLEKSGDTGNLLALTRLNVLEQAGPTST